MSMPEAGGSAPVAPYLGVDDADAAIDFYRRAFAAIELHRVVDDDGLRVLHAALMINGGLVMLSDQLPDGHTAGCATPRELGGTTVTVHLAVEDADAVWLRALAAGAVAVMPIADQPWGERYGRLRDPFGHLWSIGAPLPSAW